MTGPDSLDDGLDLWCVAGDRIVPRIAHHGPVDAVTGENPILTGKGEGRIGGRVLAVAFPSAHVLVRPHETAAGGVAGKDRDVFGEEMERPGAVERPKAQVNDGAGTGGVTHHLDDCLVGALVIDPPQPVAAQERLGPVPADAA